MMPSPEVPEFFHRFDGLRLTPGNKTAGFDAVVSTEVLKRLREQPMTEAASTQLLEQIRERVSNAGLLAESELARCGVGFVEGSWCPRFFATGPEGASIGAVPSELERLLACDALDWIGPTLSYSPHNVDSPAQALALVVIVETWAEQARFMLQTAII